MADRVNHVLGSVPERPRRLRDGGCVIFNSAQGSCDLARSNVAPPDLRSRCEPGGTSRPVGEAGQLCRRRAWQSTAEACFVLTSVFRVDFVGGDPWRVIDEDDETVFVGIRRRVEDWLDFLENGYVETLRFVFSLATAARATVHHWRAGRRPKSLGFGPPACGESPLERESVARCRTCGVECAVWPGRLRSCFTTWYRVVRYVSHRESQRPIRERLGSVDRTFRSTV